MRRGGLNLAPISRLPILTSTSTLLPKLQAVEDMPAAQTLALVWSHVVAATLEYLQRAWVSSSVFLVQQIYRQVAVRVILEASLHT